MTLTSFFERRKLSITLGLGSFCLVVILVMTFFFSFRQPNQVGIFVQDFPDGTYHASVISKTGDSLQNMMWLVRVPSVVPNRKAMHPGRCSLSYDPKTPCERYVSWKKGSEYGVIMMDRTGRWNVVWFAQEEITFRGGSIYSGGEVTFVLGHRNRIPVGAGDLRSLGLDQINAPD